VNLNEFQLEVYDSNEVVIQTITGTLISPGFFLSDLALPQNFTITIPNVNGYTFSTPCQAKLYLGYNNSGNLVWNKVGLVEIKQATYQTFPQIAATLSVLIVYSGGNEYLNDKGFLELLSLKKNREIYCRITALTWDEEKEIQNIEALVSSGSITIAGDSLVRRTASLTCIVASQDYLYSTVNSILGINRKIKLEIGMKNFTFNYTNHDILWFPQGIYVITGTSLSLSPDSYTANLTLSDKMCLLNGSISGTYPAAVTLSEMDSYDVNGELITTKPTVFQIIQEVVNHFGGEQLGRIIISDLEPVIKKNLSWGGSMPLYHWTDTDSMGNVSNHFTTDYNSIPSAAIPTIVTYTNADDVGYFYTPFTWPGGN